MNCFSFTFATNCIPASPLIPPTSLNKLSTFHSWHDWSLWVAMYDMIVQKRNCRPYESCSWLHGNWNEKKKKREEFYPPSSIIGAANKILLQNCSVAWSAVDTFREWNLIKFACFACASFIFGSIFCILPFTKFPTWVWRREIERKMRWIYSERKKFLLWMKVAGVNGIACMEIMR